jgi:hypothetical protein
MTFIIVAGVLIPGSEEYGKYLCTRFKKHVSVVV